MSTADHQLRMRNLRMLAMLGSFFLLPLAVSFWVYYGTDWRPTKRVNHGELISPARPLPQVTLARLDMMPTSPASAPSSDAELFRKKWSLVYVGSGQCDDVCRHTLYVMRQTRLSLNNEMPRVDRIFLVTADCCAREFLAHEHAGLKILDARELAAEPLLALFPATDRELSLFIVDPLGNLMMSYDTRQNPKGLLEDLKKLLALSHIG